jgi:aryl-alcohol dehydrogenase-like predicted oxidoreductase
MPIARRTINGRAVNPIGLGCMSLSWAYGTPPAEDEAARLLHRALDLGYDNLDTARLYGLGHNETLIGKTLSGRRKEFFLASKTGIIADGPNRGLDSRPGTIREQLEISLRLLQTDHIDLYYLHRLDPKVPIEDSVGALAECVAQGKIGAIGLSEMSAATLRRAAAVHPIAAMQSEYSLMTRNPDIAVLDACRELGTTFVAFGTVGRGVMVDNLPDLAALPRRDIRAAMPRYTGQNWQRNHELVTAFQAIAAREGVTAAQLANAWVLGRGDHVVAIPGTSKIAHLEENIARWDWEVPPSVSAEIDTLINRDTVAGERYSPVMQQTIDTELFEGERESIEGWKPEA